ncbi:hypothetical protein SAMN05216262_10918 [Colwellia chukchiensis]|uniref:DUF484 domain-containing protein n=1 Tax=Colwellia chukchiensis TaxID=641665 RepID=A0A1H7P8H6_9GAMM|nr:DUF484 family protein [Colwellia chukchiensis]SEL31387.1 hypothetical protein SAMN05216262_10918 [Colwellia chukchiensis]
MTQDNNLMQSNDENPMLTNDIQLTDEIIVNYLQQQPEFFNRQIELVTHLRLPDHQRGTVSLVERQLLQQREKIQSLEEEITQLMAIANQNEQLFTLYSDLYLRLLDCTTAEELLDCLHQATTQLLSLDALKLWLVKPADVSHSSLVKHDCREIMSNRLDKDAYYFGRLQQSEQELIFSQPTHGSVVLVRLRHLQHDVGFLAISSQDAEHFDPRMDTLLLSQFKKLVAKLLYQQLY